MNDPAKEPRRDYVPEGLASVDQDAADRISTAREGRYMNNEGGLDDRGMEPRRDEVGGERGLRDPVESYESRGLMNDPAKEPRRDYVPEGLASVAQGLNERGPKLAASIDEVLKTIDTDGLRSDPAASKLVNALVQLKEHYSKGYPYATGEMTRKQTAVEQAELLRDPIRNEREELMVAEYDLSAGQRVVNDRQEERKREEVKEKVINETLESVAMAGAAIREFQASPIGLSQTQSPSSKHIDDLRTLLEGLGAV
jgi:hypothetical protein